MLTKCYHFQKSYKSEKLVSETLAAISSLSPPNTRVYWDSVPVVTARALHPLHNVTLVTSPPEQDDVTDLLEELLDLWNSLHKSRGVTRCNED